MAIQIGTTTRIAEAQAVLDALTGVGPNMLIGDGPVPTSPQAAVTQNVLSQFGLSDPPLVNNGDGTLTINPPWTDPAAQMSGLATYFRIAGILNVIQGTITGPGGGGDLILDDGLGQPNVTAGQPVNIANFTLTVGNR